MSVASSNDETVKRCVQPMNVVHPLRVSSTERVTLHSVTRFTNVEQQIPECTQANQITHVGRSLHQGRTVWVTSSLSSRSTTAEQ